MVKPANIPRGGPRRNRDEQIVAAAIRIFSEKGYSAASLQDVADAVGLLKGSLYHYISSKESLLYRIFQEAHQEALVLMGTVDRLGLPPEEHLRVYVRELTLFYLRNQERSSLYFSEWRYLTGEERATVLTQRREFESYVRGVVARMKDAGLTRPELNVQLTTFYVIAAVNGIVTWYRSGGALQADDLATEVADLSLAAVVVPPDATGWRTRTRAG
ncbi:MAG: TetR/AcrR family transcriptional regulator [Mycobacteriales bacterium]